ncbi:glycosyltransferase family 2 protein [Salinicola sp. DM10]|uniref:glycosyltransferase family 2 protein n=1 Tax=Salinicola sp. DM10 TaxID=2815721 RepID=UPI001A8C0D50|nr:glycosyltransferase family 2 protein [Salinicola sp. DM10]
MKLAIAAIVKDEMDSLAEWVAYHRVIGADHFLIADNGSTDGTREWLMSLDQEAWLQHVDVATPPETPPQLVAYDKLMSICPPDVDLVCFIDADEYVMPMNEQSPEQDPKACLHRWLESRFQNSSVSAVVINWACFGSSGHKFRQEGLVIERFQMRAKKEFPPNHHYKTILRRSAFSRMVNPHHPEVISGDIVDANGEAFDFYQFRNGSRKPGLSQKVLWEPVRINHYLTKSVEEFVLKKSRRGSAARVGYEKNRKYFESHDRNDERCDVSLALASAVSEEMHELARRVEMAQVLGSQEVAPAKPRFMFSRKRDKAETPVQRLVVDYPSKGAKAKVEDGQVLVQGWLFLKEAYAEFNSLARLVIRWQPEFELKRALTEQRPDVLAHFGYKRFDDHPQLRCGFRFFLPVGISRFDIALELGQQRWPLDTIAVDSQGLSVNDVDKVRPGKSGWLFLKSDSNMSLEQHQGALMLTEIGLERWGAYFGALEETLTAHGAHGRFFITPSKEAVLEAQYGTPRAKQTAVEQILSIAPTEVIHPLSALKGLGGDAFCQTDTHWTHTAAMQASIELAVSWGLSREEVAALFKSDAYKEVALKGDLGGKLAPAVSKPVKVLSSFSNARLKVYDNAVPNFGRLVVFENAEALVDSTLLVCGSSCSAAFFNFLPRIFSRMVFAHTTGNLDKSLLEAFSPGYVLMETTARFAIRPPTSDFSVASSIREKMLSLDAAALAEIERKRVVRPTGKQDESDTEPQPQDTNQHQAMKEEDWQPWEALYQTLRAEALAAVNSPEREAP